MESLVERLAQVVEAKPIKIVISGPRGKSVRYKKIVLESKKESYYVSKYTDTQVFHETVSPNDLGAFLLETVAGQYKQINAWDSKQEYIALISKKGNASFSTRAMNKQLKEPQMTHNKQKNYLLPEGVVALPLVDLGIMNAQGIVNQSKYDKYRQINRFLEVISDGIHAFDREPLNVIDFGCGKSYLTFILYDYLTRVLGKKVEMIGLDLKEDVIKQCNETARKYGYSNLRFEVGDIHGYKPSFSVDMVVTLHACDIATDYALYQAIKWDADLIFSVPCCQHELEEQLKSDRLSLLTRYGIVKHRFSALATDAVRGNLLNFCGYKTQLLEFIDFEQTPKNIMIRAVKTKSFNKEKRLRYLDEVRVFMKEFSADPTLYRLLEEQGKFDMLLQ